MSTTPPILLSVAKSTLKNIIPFDDIDFEEDVILLNGTLYVPHQSQQGIFKAIEINDIERGVYTRIIADSTLIKLVTSELKDLDDREETLFVIKRGLKKYSFTEILQAYIQYLLSL
jgi:hypothetical protein